MSITSTRLRIALVGTAICALAATGALAGCATTSGADGPDSALIVRDGTLRVPDADCAGAAPYLFVHAGATLTIADETGAVVLDTPLSPGTAQRADDTDYGNAPRVPTFCAFDFPATGLIPGDTYTFRVGDRTVGHAEFDPDDAGVFRIGYPALGDPSSVLKGNG
ncbi:hypothetical protein [Microbacterium terrisoli]|uniref:hypothetical protein n=1 Tax=Microbacterium terrisoli TaxID=3242192 RepID=UPI00280458FE|nr:hypothetical protein [Microbacterium protaetiae]